MLIVGLVIAVVWLLLATIAISLCAAGARADAESLPARYARRDRVHDDDLVRRNGIGAAALWQQRSRAL